MGRAPEGRCTSQRPSTTARAETPSLLLLELSSPHGLGRARELALLEALGAEKEVQSPPCQSSDLPGAFPRCAMWLH